MAALLVGASAPRAQLPDYHLQLFDHNVGIRPGALRKTVRDQKGFLWILYQRAVQRFDGHRTETFPVTANLSGLYGDSQGRIWAHAPGKLFRFSEATQRFDSVPLPPGQTGTAQPLFETPDATLHLLTADAMYRYDEGRQTFAQAPTLPVTKPWSTRVAAAHGNAIFLAHGDKLYRYHLQRLTLDSLPDRKAMFIFPMGGDSAAVTTWDGHTHWYNFSRRTVTQILSPESVLDEPREFFSVRSMAAYAAGRYFLATNTGIYNYNAAAQRFKKLQFYYNGRPLATNDYANSLSVDAEGNAWLCTVDGVARFNFAHSSVGLLRLRRADDELPLAIDNVRAMVEDERENLWLATAHGFSQWNKAESRWRHFLPAHNREDRLSFPSIRGLAYDGRYLILGPTDKGTWLFDTKTLQYHRPLYADTATEAQNKQDFVDAITTLRNGSHLVMGRDELYLLDGKTYRLKRLEFAAAKENTNYAFQGSDGLVWLATMKGLHVLDSNAAYLAPVPMQGLSPFVSGAFPLPDGRLLFSCAEGLYTAAYRNGKATVTKFTDAFNGTLAQTLYVDERSYVWATTENGIYRLDPRTQKLDLFDFSDNVQGYGFSGNSWLRTRRGYLFFGGLNGLNYLRPQDVSPQASKLNVYLMQVRYGKHDSVLTDLSKPLTVHYEQRAVEVRFTAPYFNNPGKLRFRYQLEGFDEGWKDLGNNNSVRFNSLPPGRYRLVLQGSINGSDWSTAANTLRFRILDPWWLQWWFLAAVAVVLGTSLGLYIRSRNRKLHEKQEELEAEQAIAFFASRMHEHNTVDAILWDVARNCIGQLQFEDCVIYLVDEERKVLVQKAAHGPKSPKAMQIADPIEIPLGRGITGTVAQTGKAEIIPDTTKDPRYIVDDERRCSEIAVPIVSGSTVLGVIDCEHSRKRFFTQKHLSILTTIASLCANKIVRAKAQEEKAKAETALMATKQKMAEAEMQALRAQMNPHFIFNCLNSINRYIVKSDGQTASLYLTRFAKLIRLILDNSNSKAVSLANELEALKLYIEMESIRFEKKFHYRIEVAADIQPDSVSVPPLIIQPYVENAIWHGLLHKESAGELAISIKKKSPSLLECVIEDNGVGREKAKELKSKSASQKKSLGMRLTEDRLALLNAPGMLGAAIEVEDLMTSEGAAAGTKVVLRIPVDGD